MRPHYTPEQLNSLAETALRDGFCILKGHFSREKLQDWRERFAPMLSQHIAREGHLKNRGAGRYYVTLPFTSPWAEPDFFDNDDILTIVERLVGKDMVMCQLATDTPLLGSDYQELHRDTPPLFPELPFETPSFQLAVNFPLVDVTPENGPIEIVRGTHMMPKAEAMAKLESGELKLEAFPMELGDVMIRDVRGIHRGTPNRTQVPRPMVVIGYSRRWLFRPEVSIRVPRETHERLSDRARRMLRYNPVVESLETEDDTEVYQAFAY